MGAHGICAGQIMASKNELISQSFGTALQTKKPSNGRSRTSDESYISCMILLFLLFSGTSPGNRITGFQNETERPVEILTATLPKIHRPALDLAFAPRNLVSNPLSQTQSTQALQGQTGDYKTTFPIKKPRLPLVNIVNTSQILTKIQNLKRRGWPKLRRLSQAIHHNSRRILLLRAHLSLLQSELEERTSSRNGSMKTIVCKQELTKPQLPPGRMYLVGSFLIQHFLKRGNDQPFDGDMPELAALLIDQFHRLRA
jgi:hypothetical protein